MRWLAILVTAMMSVSSQAREPLKVAAGRIPYVFHSEQPGSYNQIFDQLVRDLGRPVELHYFPLKRAMKRMAMPDYHCFAMALKNSPNWAKIGLNADDYRFIGPISKLNIKVYVRPGNEELSQEDLTGKLITAGVSIVNLHDQYDALWRKTEIVATDSFVDALTFLSEGRSSAALAYDVDVRLLGRNHPLQGRFVDTGISILTLEDGIVCKRTPELVPVVESLQAAIDGMAIDGTLKRLLGE